MALSLEQFAQQIVEAGLLPTEDVGAVRAASNATDAEQLARAFVRQKKLTAFQAQQAYSGKAKSLVLGNYIVLDKLGQGGMGMVLKAEHRRMKRTVALKVLSPNVIKTKELVSRFHREVQAAARLEHPNIVASYDADEANGTHFFVMQYVDGNDLSSVVKSNGPLPIEQAVNCILQAARGLEFAHQHGVIHRDIKPANLLLDDKGTVKILDMGLARIEGETGSLAELTSTGAVMGTIDYMAPEQARNTKTADARSDIYSLGISLWYLLVGKPAYEGSTLTERLLAHQSDPIPSLCAVRGDVPPIVDAVFQQMVAKGPADRYQTMTAVIAALESVLRGDVAAAPSIFAAPSDDSKFSEFLAAMAKTDRGPRSTALQKAATLDVTAAVVTEDLQPTLTSANPESLTDPQLALTQGTSIARQRTYPGARAWWQDWRVHLGAGVGAVAVIALAAMLIPNRPQIKAPASSSASGAISTTSSTAEFHQSQADVVKWLLSVGGIVTVKVDGNDLALTSGDPLPSGQLDVYAVDLTSTPSVVLDDLHRLNVFPRRIWLNAALHLNEVQSAQVLGRLSNIAAVVLASDEPLTAATGESYGESPINYFHIGNRRLEPGSLAAFRRMPLLNDLLIGSCEVTPQVLAELSQLPHLYRVTLEGAITDEHLAALTLPNLTKFVLVRTDVSPSGIADFQRRHPICSLDDVAPQLSADSLTRLATDPPEFALTFDGFDQHVAIPTLRYPGDMLTLEAWIEPGLLSNSNYLAIYDGQHNASLWGGAGINGFTVTTPTGTLGGKQDNPLEVGRWYHVAGVFDRKSTSYFLDGRLIQSNMAVGLAERTGLEPATWLGGVPNISFWHGKFRAVRISNTPRYAADFVPQRRFSKEPDTLALYHFDEGQGDVLKDSSGNNHHGKIVGAKWVLANASSFLTTSAAADLTGPAPSAAKAPFDAAQARAHQEAWATHLGVPVEYTNSLGMKFVLIPPGEFTRGSSAKQIDAALRIAGNDRSWQDSIRSEAPQHKVILTQSIYVGVHEVTQAEYQQVVGKNPSEFAASGRSKDSVAGLDTGTFPVDMVSWSDAAEFCVKLSERERLKPFDFQSVATTTPIYGAGYRLPSEAEWEFACGAGTSTGFWIGDDDAKLQEAGWFGANAGGRTHTVAELRPNPFGLFDVHGNVWEWVQDGWEPTSYSQYREQPAVNPLGPSTARSQQGLRGGSWRDTASGCRTSYRAAVKAMTVSSSRGFRVVLSVEAVRRASTDQ